jgi:hypothetical protein
MTYHLNIIHALLTVESSEEVYVVVLRAAVHSSLLRCANSKCPLHILDNPSKISEQLSRFNKSPVKLRTQSFQS